MRRAASCNVAAARGVHAHRKAQEGRAQQQTTVTNRGRARWHQRLAGSLRHGQGPISSLMIGPAYVMRLGVCRQDHASFQTTDTTVRRQIRRGRTAGWRGGGKEVALRAHRVHGCASCRTGLRHKLGCWRVRVVGLLSTSDTTVRQTTIMRHGPAIFHLGAGWAAGWDCMVSDEKCFSKDIGTLPRSISCWREWCSSMIFPSAHCFYSFTKRIGKNRRNNEVPR